MRTRTLTIILTLLIALLIGFAWWVYFQSEGKLHWAVPTLCTLGPILIVVTILLVQRLMAANAASGLERALVVEGAQQHKRVAPARSAEVDRLRSEFERAVGALKTSKLGRGQKGARNALFELPWYTIIGPPASGKTTALRNSGLKFPHLAGTGDRLKGIGGTRNCDWWLTNHAILLDTAGRWTTEEEDRDEWLAFLDLLKTHRKGHPLNGVIAAISLAGDPETSITGVDTEGVKQLAGRMRERLDEITGRLGVALPVYLIFTKCDLISGFVEAFGEMGPQERRQIWGFTAPLLTGPVSAPGVYFAEQFDQLAEALEQHTVVRLGHEVEPDVLSKVYEFPAQFSALRGKLVTFVDELFEESAYGETPIMRGGYFTSGTQEGAPADLLLEDMAQSLNVRPPQQESTTEKKSYFLHDMLVDVVFEDRQLATASQAELLRQQKLRKRWTTSLFAAAILLPVVSAVSCELNLDALDQTRELVDRIRQEQAPDPATTVPVRMRDLLDLDAEVQRYQAGMPSLMAGFGFYQGDDLEPHLTRYFGTALKEWVIRPLMNRNNEKLITITQQLEGLRMQGQGGALDEASRAELLEAFKLHLLLTNPREECIPNPLARKNEVVARLLALWNQGSVTKDRKETAGRQALIVRYLELLNSDKELAVERDKRRVELARAALGGQDQAGQLLTGVIERFGKEPKDFARLVGASTVFQSSQPVHGAFTVEAWQTTWREVAAGQPFGASEESWILGCEQLQGQEARAAENTQAFEREYLKRYEENWRRFIDGLSARAPTNAVEAEGMLGELIGRPGVLGLLFQRVKENTDLPPIASDKPLDKALDAAKQQLGEKLGTSKQLAGTNAGMAGASDNSPEARLARSFESFVNFGTAGPAGGDPPLEQYRKQIEPVYMALKAFRTDESKVNELGIAAQAAIDGVELLLSGHAGEFNARLRELLVPPIAGVLDIVHSGRGAQLQRSWCEQVYRPFQEELGGRYPFQVSSTSPASLQAFQRFFQPGTGVIWAFQSAQLAGYIVAEGDRFRSGPQNAGTIREELVTFLNRASEVRQAFFPGGSATPRMPFRIRVRGAAGYSVTTFSVGQKSIRYDSGVETWVPVEWPGEQASLGATLTVKPYQGAGPRPLTVAGEWGLFMILDEKFGHGEILERGENQFTAGWKPKGGQLWIKVDFASDDRRSPLMSVPFGSQSRSVLPIAIPARITQAGGGC
jgi:type VI secretion system protein ImpL